jgi:hypothetical protein
MAVDCFQGQVGSKMWSASEQYTYYSFCQVRLISTSEADADWPWPADGIGQFIRFLQVQSRARLEKL